MNIKDLLSLQSPGTYNVKALLIKMTQETSKTNQLYTIVTLQDQFGTIDARKWDIEMFNNCKINDVLNLELDAKEYNGRINFTIKNYSIDENAKSSDFTGDFTPDISTMKTYLTSLVKELCSKNDNYKTIFTKLFKINSNDFFEYPAAASMHHDLKYGLLFHTTSMIKHAKGLIKSTQEIYSKDVNEDLIYAAIIIHDYFKIKEYKVNDAYKAEYTRFSLIGHISMAAQFIGSLYFNHEIDEELYLNLSHIILSHHGQLEHGSPIVPATIEALIVHTVDMFDSRLYMFKDEIRKIDAGTLSKNRNYGLGTAVYSPNYSDLNDELPY